MKRILSAITALMAFITMSADESSIQQEFGYKSFSLATNTIAYREALICHDGQTAPLLILYLHGGTSRGDDNESQLNEKAVTDIFYYLTEHNIAATMVVPQCPSGGGWTNQLRKVVNELLRTYVTSGAVDESRVYVTGGSMGGTGTWCQLSYFPYFYAAAMPVAGNPTNLSADNISKTPVYTVMGTDDTIMDVSPVEELRQQVTQNNGTMIMDVEEG